MCGMFYVSMWEFLARKLLVETSGLQYWLSYFRNCMVLISQGHTSLKYKKWNKL